MEKRTGFVTIIGRPNVGKSTLMNKLIGQKIAITSNKPQTTRSRIRGIYTEDRGQIIFLDTPGLQKAKNKLGSYMEEVTKSSVTGVDLILWIVEPESRIGEGDRRISEIVKSANVPVIIAINKIDSIKKEEILPVIDTYRSLEGIDEIVPISAKSGVGCTELVDVLYNYLPYGPMFYDEDTITDQPERAICAEIIREKSLHALSQEVPHGIAVTIESMKERKGGKKTGDGKVIPFFDIEATIICERDSHKGIIIGKGGSMLKKIGANARYEIEHMLDAGVNLKLWVKVKKDWRNSDVLIKNYGYDEKQV
ncbi:MAG: GTPase Era [Lachnospiraceae bacterium]|nr:GTPase Era [Lachnospiraceae bacterium]